VSLSLRNEVRVGLAPDHVALARVSWGWRRRIAEKRLIPLDCAKRGDWHPSIEALDEILGDAKRTRAEATVILSSHFVRHALVPWSEHLASDEEKEAWVRHHFIELYGESDVPAEYRWSEERPDELCVATAIDRELLAQIAAAFERSGLRLRSVQPYLMAAFNRWRRRIRHAPTWLVVPEAGRICICGFAGRRWQMIASQRVDSEWRADLQRVLERQILLSGEDAPAHVLVCSPDELEPAFAYPGDLQLEIVSPRALPGYAPPSDAAYGLALAGVA
jgi:hypothetical protein